MSDPVLALLDAPTGRCRLWAEQEEGPYRRGEQPRRRDVIEGRPGTPLALGLRLLRESGDPLEDADVEIWHCDARGRYSGYPPPEPGGIGSAEAAARAEHLADESFLRGRQTTDPRGRVEFRTIYPGWYPGRTVHIHLMVHIGHRTCTSQLYFPEPVTATVFAQPPYRDRGAPDTTNETDEVFRMGGDPAILQITRGDSGYLGVHCLVAAADAAVT